MIRYVALGDSLTVGTGRSMFSPNFAQRYVIKTERIMRNEISLDQFARVGATTEDILIMINHPFVKEELDKANIISITAGGNDLIDAVRSYERQKDETVFYEALSKCQDNLSKIFYSIHEMKQDNNDNGFYIIRLFNLYNPFPKVEVAEHWISKFNHHIHTFNGSKNTKVIDMNQAFDNHEEELISRDGIHPNDNGYELMAELLKDSTISAIEDHAKAEEDSNQRPV